MPIKGEKDVPCVLPCVYNFVASVVLLQRCEWPCPLFLADVFTCCTFIQCGPNKGNFPGLLYYQASGPEEPLKVTASVFWCLFPQPVLPATSLHRKGAGSQFCDQAGLAF